MNKDELFSKLATTKPGRMNFELSDRILSIDLSIKDIERENMQKNNSAFESWMLCIMAKLGTEIDKVILKWAGCTEKKCHYNRFMYRVMKSKQYFKWFDIAPAKQDEYDAFVRKFNDTDFVLNYPNTVVKNDVNDESEAFYERELFKKTELYRGEAFEAKDQQLPVGVFCGVKSKTTSFFTCGHSAIDLWGIKDDAFWVFELKYKNKMIGIITELLFYMWFCEDTFINKKFKYDIQGIIPTIRSFDKLYNFSAKSIVGVMLFDEIHSLLQDGSVVGYINSQLCGSRLSITTQQYKLQLQLL